MKKKKNERESQENSQAFGCTNVFSGVTTAPNSQEFSQYYRSNAPGCGAILNKVLSSFEYEMICEIPCEKKLGEHAV